MKNLTKTSIILKHQNNKKTPQGKYHNITTSK